ncbi:protein kinase domain-containing protein [Pseudoduganella namucuonensis]|uniref:non-specific serine/threonine protein kinase n=1 Tax=Pseudoduganella namucuonensis TaxID=1035707 RepID=A0A1I7F0G8_9BURK|nr:serine/threonine-protein kinase [Pseudoduganella namucuonensis]SFU29649.1 serine/threonine protein kinase [Pseudoduganella namucuonensis]
MQPANLTTQELPDAVMLGHYQLRRPLGEGGYGQVFEAWDERLQRCVAIKRLKQAAALPPGALLREARLSASLAHRAFVHVFDVGGQEDNPYIVMELVRGKTLRQCLRERTLDGADPLAVAAQIAEAMAVAHASGLIHGDLKPSNIILEPGGAPRILDFGLARHLDPLATGSTAGADPQGTIAYMAPERLAGKPSSVRSDIYALGVVLYELATGARPYPELQGLALAAALMQPAPDAWPIPDGADPALARLIRELTAHDPAHRPPTMREAWSRIAALRGRAAFGGPLAVPLAGPLASPLAPSPATALATAPAAFLAALQGRRSWPPRAALALAAVALTAGLLALAPWRAPSAPERPAAAPFSETAAMRAGMAALHGFDRDGSLDTAVASFSSVLRHNPRHAAAAAALSLAHSLRYSGDGRDPAWLQLARAGAQQALLLDDQLALAHAAAGDAARLAGEHQAAAASYARALKLDPGAPHALAGQGNLLLAMRRHGEAEELLLEAQRRWPRERRFADQLGTLYFQQGDYARAEAAFRHSLRLEPDAVYAYANLNAALLRLGRDEEALQVLQQGLQLRPNGRLYSNLGTTLFARGDYAGAAQAFQHAASGAKGNPGDYLKWANLADALRWLPGRQADSQQAYRRAVALLAPEASRPRADAVLLSRMGLYLAHLPPPAAALAWTDGALERAPASADIQFRAAVAYELAGRRDAAVACLVRARTLGYPGKLIDAEPDLIAPRRDARYLSHLLESAK